MASVNKVIIVGNLGRDPETRYLPSGEAVTNISVATTETWKDKASGEKKEATEWHRISFFGKLAEIAGEYLKKGRTVYIEGALRTSSWDDKESGQKKYKTEVIVNDLVMLGGAEGGSGGGRTRGAAANSGMDQRAPEEAHSQAAEITDDDIPF